MPTDPGLVEVPTDPGLVEVPTDPELVEVSVHCVSVSICVAFNYVIDVNLVCRIPTSM